MSTKLHPKDSNKCIEFKFFMNELKYYQFNNKLPNKIHNNKQKEIEEIEEKCLNENHDKYNKRYLYNPEIDRYEIGLDDNNICREWKRFYNIFGFDEFRNLYIDKIEEEC